MQSQVIWLGVRDGRLSMVMHESEEVATKFYKQLKTEHPETVAVRQIIKVNVAWEETDGYAI